MSDSRHNPILRGQFADPSMIRYGGRYYLYPTSDGFDGWSGTAFRAFSAADPMRGPWTDEGVILDLAAGDVPWAVGSAWAPAMFEKNGRFYFYFCGKRPDGVSCIGAAVSDSPVSGFKPMPEPLLALDRCRAEGLRIGQTIDPSVFEDKDSGEVYLLFGNGQPAVVRLTEDLCHTVPGTMRNIAGLTDFREAVDVVKRGGVYHFTWSCDDTGSEDYHVNYGIADSVYGPVTFLHTILSKKPEWDILGTGHHCVFREPDRDEYLIAYHRFATPTDAYPGYHGFHREVCVDRLEFDENNRMKPVVFEEPACPAGGYLFVHFTSELPEKDGSGRPIPRTDNEQIYMALSRDGLRWRDLSPTPVLRSGIGDCGVRDPFPVRDPHTGRVYLIATDLCTEGGTDWGKAQFAGSRDIIVWESDDLIRWSPERAVTVGIPGAGCVWAPEAVYEPKTDSFFVFFASMVADPGEKPKQRIYACRTKDFRAFTEPFLWIERPEHIIDTTVFRRGRRFFRISGDSATRRLLFETADKLEGEWTILGSETLADLPGVEGPETYLLPDGKTLCLIADRFAAGLGYLPMTTGAPGEEDFRILGTEKYDMGKLKKRHGGILRITDSEFERLSNRETPCLSE